MANKKKRVDIVSVSVVPLVENQECPTFADLLRLVNGTEHSILGKIHEIYLRDTDRENCLLGFVETTQDKDIPPIKNKQTKALSAVNINVQEEGLAFANVFMFDTDMKVLIYEVNRNGCYLQTLKDLLESKWNSEHDQTPIEIHFAAVCRFDEYQRMLQMTGYRKISYEICQPTLLLEALREEENSLAKNLLKSQAEAAANNNVNYVSIEQKCDPLWINRDGIQSGWAREFSTLVNRLCGGIARSCIRSYKVHGFTIDPESDRPKSVTIDLMQDVFDVCITIPEVQVQTSLQQQERKAGIENLYDRVKGELQVIIGRN